MGERIVTAVDTLENKVSELARMYYSFSEIRDPRLFTEFLVKGYQITTLDSVPKVLKDQVIYAKVCLGMIITLYDDLADRPESYNPSLLKLLYEFNLNHCPNGILLKNKDQEAFELVQHLFSELASAIAGLPSYKTFFEILIFDIKHIFLANHYSELMTGYSELSNLTESKLFGPYNMGMVAAGMIDLMGSPPFDHREIGKLREVLIIGQRIGRIGNLLSTYEREIKEGDQTNEILLHSESFQIVREKLFSEATLGLSKIQEHRNELQSLDIGLYRDGLEQLVSLHQQMEGVI